MARILRTLRLGFKSLLLHKLRSGLAMLGILIGVMAVIWLVALGEGVSYQAQQQIMQLGATNIIVKSAKPANSSSNSGGGGSGSFIVNYGLTWDDYDRIISSISTIKRAVPMREIKAEVRATTRRADIQLLGCTPDYYEINHLDMDRGRFLTDTDSVNLDNVCVLADGAAQKLFPYEDPIGKEIQVICNDSVGLYTVIGRTKSRDPSAAIGGSLEGRDYNMDIYIPLETFRARIGDRIITARSGTREGEEVELNQITITVNDIDDVETAAGVVEFLLKKFHNPQPNDPVDYTVTVPKELLRQAEMLRMMFNVLLVLIAGISLLVGGIGIMNIMLATVTERTREIGVRRAMGATRKDIINQFLAETVVLSATGGIVGVLLGFTCWPATDAARELIQQFLPEVWSSIPPTIQNLEPRLAYWSIFASFGISVAVGVAFGLYPARRAALMDPIEALRNE